MIGSKENFNNKILIRAELFFLRNLQIFGDFIVNLQFLLYICVQNLTIRINYNKYLYTWKDHHL